MVVDPALVQWVNTSCVAQGIPALVTDPMVIARVCALLTGRAPGGGGLGRRRDPALAGSETPDGFDTVGVEAAGPTGSGEDHAVVEDSLDDGDLTVERESRPLSAEG